MKHISQLNFTYFRNFCPKGVQFSDCLQCSATSLRHFGWTCYVDVKGVFICKCGVQWPKRELISCLPVSTQIVMLCEAGHNHQLVARNHVWPLFSLPSIWKPFLKEILYQNIFIQYIVCWHMTPRTAIVFLMMSLETPPLPLAEVPLF